MYTAYPLIALGTLRKLQGSFADAAALSERALTIRERSLGPDSLLVAVALVELARALLEVGNTSQALLNARRALNILDRAGAAQTAAGGDAQEILGRIEFRLGHAAAARAALQQAVAARERTYGFGHPFVASAKLALASAMADGGDIEHAYTTALEAEALSRDNVATVVRYLSERQALYYAARRSRGLDLTVSLTERSPRSTASTLDRVIRSRSIVLDEMARRHSVTPASDAEDTVAMRASLIALRQRTANLVVKGPGRQPPDEYQATLARLRQERELAERSLAERSSNFRTEQKEQQFGLLEVQRGLPDRSALVSFYQYERTVFDRTPAAGPTSMPPDVRTVQSYAAFVPRSDSLAPVLIPLGEGATIDALINHWRSGVMRGLVTERETELRLRQRGVALRQRIWDPVAVHLKGVRQVFVVPDGSVNLVPLVALPVGSSSYLLEAGPSIHHLSAERDLVTERPVAASRGMMLAVGNPSFEDSVPLTAQDATASEPRPGGRGGSNCPSFQTMQFPVLPGSGREANAVGTLWTRFNGASADSLTVLVGPTARERTFKELSSQSRVLHLATHGFFLGSACDSPSDGARSVGGLVARNKPGAKPKPVAVRPGPDAAPSGATSNPQNPLLLSGLAMAGANRRAVATGDEDDGILTAEEVASLDLSGVEWAVLSACNTGLGEIHAGEGVFGLRRAFQIAGAHTVIMSLWSVEDRAALAWMRALYEGRLARKLDTAAAVREASLTVLRQRRAKGQSTHPFYWAGFVASGDWR